MDLTCGRDGLTPKPLTDTELEGVRQALWAYRSDELVARLLATVVATRAGAPY